MLILRSLACVALVSVLSALDGCASGPPPKLNPYGRPYTEDNVMKPGPLRSCSGEFDTLPQLQSGTLPLYPVHELIMGRTGDAKVEFRVGADGSLTVLDKSDDKASRWYAKHAAVAMRDWVVEPARKGQTTVEARCELKFSYQHG